MIRHFLYRLTAKLPCRLIHREGGARYLERYALGQRFGITAYLHRFVADDADEWVHDHPWSWAIAIVLTGGYREERLRWFDADSGWESDMRQIGGWRRVNIIRGADFHRIVKTRPETWTLFIHGPRVKSWGFLQRKQGKGGTQHAAVYDQPYDVTQSIGWEMRAPLGRNADRAPMDAI